MKLRDSLYLKESGFVRSLTTAWDLGKCLLKCRCSIIAIKFSDRKKIIDEATRFLEVTTNVESSLNTFISIAKS